MTDPVFLKNRFESVMEGEFSVGDDLANNFPELIRNYGNGMDLPALWGNVINGLGQRGISALATAALNKAKRKFKC